MALGLGIVVYWATQSGPAAAIVSAFKSRVIADGGTVESPSCAKSDVKFLLDNPPPLVFDADYQAILDRSTALGYTEPSTAQQILQNTLVTDLKTAGVWDKLDALYIMANDGSREFGRLNWASPSTFELSEVNSPTFTSNQGFTGDAPNSKTLDTGITLDTNTTHFSTTNKEGSFGGWSYYTKLGGAPALMGTDAYNNDIRGGANDHIMEISAGYNVLITGLYHMNASPNGTNITATQYANGSAVITGGGLPAPYTSATMHLLSEGGTDLFGDDTISIAFIGGDLSAEASDLYDAFNTYMGAI